MALVNDVMSLFRPAPPQQQQRQEPTLADKNPTVPSPGDKQPDGSGPRAFPVVSPTDNPLSDFKDLFEPSKDPIVPLSMTPDMQFDGKALMEAARQMNFAAGVPSTLITKAFGESADQEAITALLNTVSQNAYAQALAASGVFMHSNMTKQETALREKVLPDALRTFTINNSVNENVNLANNPAAAPLINLLTGAATQRFPNASAKEISEYVGKYVKTFAESIVTPAAPGGNQLQATKDTDWEAFFEGPPSATRVA